MSGVMDKRASLKMQRALRATWWKKMAQSYGRETPEATGAIEMFGEPNLPHPEYTRGYADGVNDGWRDATAAERGKRRAILEELRRVRKVIEGWYWELHLDGELEPLAMSRMNSQMNKIDTVLKEADDE